MSPLLRKCAAEFLGSAFLIATVIGSGIMATNLTDNVALQLLCNTAATAGALVALIAAFGSVSGAHFNPVVTIADRVFKGKITRNAQALDPASRTMLVEVQVPNPDKILLAGMYTTVRFNLNVQKPPIVVPGASVMMGADGTRIAVVGPDDVITIREVRLGRDFGKTVEIISGCAEGERIVMSPSDLLRSGLKVRVAATPTAQPK